MKKISVLMAAFMAVCMSALADDGIKVNPLTIAQGETADLEIMFECAEAQYVGFQFDVAAESVGFNIDLDEEEGYEAGNALAKSHTIHLVRKTRRVHLLAYMVPQNSWVSRK